jgi:DNA polymerase-3 subunit epsilon
VGFVFLYCIIKVYLFSKQQKMELKLTRPICFFDLETTGIDVAKDRIVEIAIFKVFPNGNKESKTWLVNPTVPIPPQSTAVHGISNEKVANEPTFKELAPVIYNMIKDSDLAGYNSDRFDIPLLAEELLRAGVDFDMKGRVSVDVQTVFHKKEERTLSAALKFLVMIFRAINPASKIKPTNKKLTTANSTLRIENNLVNKNPVCSAVSGAIASLF